MDAGSSLLPAPAAEAPIMSIRRRMRPSGFGYARVIAFLIGWAVLIIFVSRYYLYPALEAAAKASPKDKKLLAAHASLLLALLLFMLLVGLILTFKIGRFFQPRNRPRPKATNYPDAWAESARRVEVPPEDE
jgi:hypothetical protein